ncbi:MULTISPECIES: oxygenase MpaB family protein [unclassified Streptomyces]|uniref:oxygenase MpaB family protein n=1 Tax=unclassified Streptomyces TaxID=2593676 RepID=UPI002366EFD9|nr:MULTISPECIES: oxygenase MpaB family protein [unclassified Streptomyces]MDF3144190.1 oxygenase MpaB family protein [Streptomyces sp. T21Q-yed]WDF36345.1 oxygenase MpaB family protein [Streptomyces sp. T12]
MTAHFPPRNPAERAVGTDAAPRRHGAEADHLLPQLTAGDPLADAVIAELDLHGTRARQALDAGLEHGLAGLDDEPPTAVAALLRQLESTPSWVDPLMLHRGDVVSLSVPPMWFRLCSITSALAHTYASPATARQLARTGRPTAMAAPRLAEAGVWARQTIRPGGLLRGGPGYLATVQVRLRHARMRARAVEDWDTGAQGLPIGRLDLTRTWLGFTLTAFQALATIGIDISSEDERYLYRYWSYVAHLLGLDESLHQEPADHDDAHRLQSLLDATTPAPGEDSRLLIAAMVDAQARATAGAPGVEMTEEQVRSLMHSVLRRALGAHWADRLGIPAVSAATDLTPLISQLNRQARYWQTYSAASADEARRQALRDPVPEPKSAVLPHGTSRRRKAETDRPGCWAA